MEFHYASSLAFILKKVQFYCEKSVESKNKIFCLLIQLDNQTKFPFCTMLRFFVL
jgi:hypothetical protein